MSTIAVDFKDLREGDQAVLSGADWTMTGKVVGHDARLYVGTVRISQGIFVSATREVPDVQLPTAPGAYADKDGDPWILDASGYWGDEYGSWRQPDEVVKRYAPFTRLLPESEVRAEVEAEIARWLRSRHYSGLPGEIERGEYR